MRLPVLAVVKSAKIDEPVPSNANATAGRLVRSSNAGLSGIDVITRQFYLFAD